MMTARFPIALPASALTAALLGAVAPAAAQAPLVHVALDMDPAAPGRQHTVRVRPGTTFVTGVSVSIYAASGQPSMYTIGYIGGLDRGIAFGHQPRNNQGQATVTSIAPHPGTPVNPANSPQVYRDNQGIMPVFAGPEVQYLEWGPGPAAVIPAVPPGPVFTADITLTGAAPGDVLDFYLFDVVAGNWLRLAGAFSAQSGGSLDSGGDSVPDGTVTMAGIDQDPPHAVPPAAFLVDYIDGPPGGGPATIVIACAGDHNLDGAVNSQDFFDYLRDFFAGDAGADFNRDGAINSQDFFDFLGAFFGPC